MTEHNRRPHIAVFNAQAHHPWPGLDVLSDRAEFTQTIEHDALAEALASADVFVVTDFNTELIADVWHHAEKVRWVHATSAGVDQLMFPALVASDVVVTNAQGVFDQPIAETVLGWMLYFAKDMPTTLRLQRERTWRHRDSERLAGKRLVVVGAGSIGSAVARLARAAGMDVIGVARRARGDDPEFAAVVGSNELHAVLAEADYVVAAAPLTPATRGMLDAAAFAAMPERARFINIGRGELVDTDALVSALASGDIAAAALDVFETEPLPADHPLWGFDNVIVSPHMAGDVKGWRRALSEQFIELFDRWVHGRPLFNLVDKARGYVATWEPEDD